jgi:hypothetical protein
MATTVASDKANEGDGSLARKYLRGRVGAQHATVTPPEYNAREEATEGSVKALPLEMQIAAGRKAWHNLSCK